MKRIVVLLLIMLGLCFSQEQGAKYLIITHDYFYDAIRPFAWWKHKKGVMTKVVKLSDIGSTSYAIRNYIINAYNTWQVRPDFLLLVGAPNYIPFPQVSWTYTDNYYSNVTGDIHNEILSGRLTVHSVTEAQTVVNKMLRYERIPDVTDSLWFVKGCLIVNEDYDPDDTIYWNDAKYVANQMVLNNYVHVDTFSAAQGDNATSVVLAANDGRSFVVYRGSATNNWYYPFAVNPNGLGNGNKLPIVISATCNTLGTGSTPATAERWFLTGTATTPRGASGYFATTTGGYNMAYLRSAVTRGFSDAIFIDGKKTFGEASEAGRQRVYNMYPYSGGAEEYYGFTTIGDPEMNIWTAIPQPIEVEHDTMLFLDAESLVVGVTCHDVPFESALVCIVLDTVVYEYGYASPGGGVVLYFSNLIEGEMDITVTGRNVIPYEGIINVVSSGIDVMPKKDVVRALSLEIYPNPCRGKADVRLQMPDISLENEGMKIRIYNASGQCVRSLSLPARYSLPSAVFSWDCTDDSGKKLQAGIYFCQVRTAGGTFSEKIIVLQ